MVRNKYYAVAERYSSFDFLKGIGCIFVVFIHVLFPGMFGRAVMKIAGFAVPGFLMISGYFAYNIKENDKVVLWKRAKHILLIMVCSFIFYFVFTLLIKILGHGVTEWLEQFVSIKCWIRILVFSNLDIVGGGHLWYLPSLFIAYLVIIALNKKGIIEKLYRFLPSIFILRTIVYIVTLSMGLSWHFRGNVLVDTLPWMLLGHYLASNPKFLNQLSDYRIMLLSGVGLIIGVVFEVLSFGIDLSEIGITVYSICIFLLALRHPTNSKCKVIEMIGEKYSLDVYVFHIAVSVVITKCFCVVKNNTFVIWSKPIVVVIVTIICSMILFIIKDRITLFVQKIDERKRINRR